MAARVETNELTVTRPDQAATEKVVVMKGVSKHYGDKTVLQPLDLEVRNRERLVVIGTSGSGKTTLLRVLIGLERPDAGSVLVCGESLWHRQDGRPAKEKDVRRVRRNVGIVFQHFNLFPHMTALENVMEGLVHVRRQPPLEARERATRLLERVGLGGKLETRPGKLSGGQQQRVAIARALALEPRVMLFDEVTSALDPELVGEVLAVIRELAVSSDMALIIVTHEMRFAKSIADRLLVFDGGVVVEEGPPEQIFGAPKSERTQKFLRALEEAE